MDDIIFVVAVLVVLSYVFKFLNEIRKEIKGEFTDLEFYFLGNSLFLLFLLDSQTFNLIIVVMEGMVNLFIGVYDLVLSIVLLEVNIDLFIALVKHFIVLIGIIFYFGVVVGIIFSLQIGLLELLDKIFGEKKIDTKTQEI